MTKLQNHKSTPVIFVNLSLPPSERYRTRNILLSCLIPGPKSHKDFDSFLVPTIEELNHLGREGVDNVYNDSTGTLFTLRAFVILVTGDGPASAEAMGMKNPGNAYRPCHHCMIEGEKGANGIYYIPHTNIDVDSLPARKNLRQVLTSFGTITNKALREAKGKELGLTRASILLELQSLRFPESFPLDLMHCLHLNISPMLHTLMGGRKSADDPSSKSALRKYQKRVAKDFGEAAAAALVESEAFLPPQDCVISVKNWREIGAWQESSRKTIPSLLGQGPRPIDTRVKGYKAAEWEAWLVRDGLTLMAHMGPAFLPYLQNFSRLRDIYLLATARTITPQQLHTLRCQCYTWVTEFEDLYHGGDFDRLSVCKINAHSLLHLGKLRLKPAF